MKWSHTTKCKRSVRYEILTVDAFLDYPFIVCIFYQIVFSPFFDKISRGTCLEQEPSSDQNNFESERSADPPGAVVNEKYMRIENILYATSLSYNCYFRTVCV